MGIEKCSAAKMGSERKSIHRSRRSIRPPRNPGGGKGKPIHHPKETKVEMTHGVCISGEVGETTANLTSPRIRPWR